MKIAVVMLAAALAGLPSEHMTFSATSVNVAQPGTPVKITLTRWSTDAERTSVVNAFKVAPVPDRGTSAEPARGRGAAAGRGRGRGRGAPAAPLSPIASFTAALGRAPTIGYLWTDDITGYSIKYAWHSAALADGTERIVLASDRRLGAYTTRWKPTAAVAETDYTFTVIELRVAADGALEGKTSLTSKIGVDGDSNTIVLDGFASAPTILTRKTRVAATRPVARQ